ncbi:MAG: GIY-YIG nuclease family protein, partial [Bacteroidetes bacterium]|nr:GIY-YIG nuclease family protein [Bacteroidota bacterium]
MRKLIFFKMFSTYILKSQKDYMYYYGHTNNLEKRLK